MAGKLQSIREIVDDLMSEPDRAQKWFEQKLANLKQASLKKVPKKRAQSVKSEKRTKKRVGVGK
jgi:putative heme iron utilization protein